MTTRDRSELAPLTRSVTVEWGAAAAFNRFTHDLGAWWPLRTHSVGQDRARTCIFEPRVGGRIYEVEQDGAEHLWGTVTAWEPPRRVAFTWHPGRGAETAGNVEVRFEPAGSGTRLVLIHGGWERLGRMARVARRSYRFGWGYVLAVWAGQKAELSARAVHVVGIVISTLAGLGRRRR